jgi:hypothetical protein
LKKEKETSAFAFSFGGASRGHVKVGDKVRGDFEEMGG